MMSQEMGGREKRMVGNQKGILSPRTIWKRVEVMGAVANLKYSKPRCDQATEGLGPGGLGGWM